MTAQPRPLVSFVTGTYQRPDMLKELIENVRQQTYRPLEHCIAAEPSADPSVNEAVRSVIAWARDGGTDVPIKFIETGRWWSGFLANSISAVPYQMAQWMSSGEYLCWLADDERLREDHVEKLVALAESSQADFAYPLQGCYWRGAITRHVNWIGGPVPQYGQITHALYRAELLDYRGFEINVGSGTDWDQVRHWMAAGARWAFLPEQTFTHRVDKAGDAGARLVKQPLRGHTPRNEAEKQALATRARIDCLCVGVSARRCWCHTSQGGSDNKPCKCPEGFRGEAIR